jgi:AbrB family looped-hinge helix DNA binding protein
METTKLSSKGQVIIPKPFRAVHGWEPGQELVVINTNDGVLLKPKSPFQETNLEEVAACLSYSGKPKTLDDMEQAIRQGVNERLYGSS